MTDVTVVVWVVADSYSKQHYMFRNWQDAHYVLCKVCAEQSILRPILDTVSCLTPDRAFTHITGDFHEITICRQAVALPKWENNKHD